MLRKRSRPLQKDQSRGQLMADLASDSSFFSNDNTFLQKSRNTLFFNVPNLFIGFKTKGIIDSDSQRSPTSPLDYKLFTSLSNSFVKSPKSSSYDCKKVGLRLIDSLNNESSNILFGPKLRMSRSHLNSLKHEHVLVSSPKSLPKNFGMTSQTQLDSPKFSIGSPLVENSSGSLPVPIDIELSEDYTCVISHGPNPKTTHIFGDCVIGNDTIWSLDYKNNVFEDTKSHFGDFLSHCFRCKKKLEQGEDIYMYRGEKAFCSSDCRDEEILLEEEMEKARNGFSDDYEEIFTS